MDLIRTLNSVGKSTFIKYYFDFKNESRDKCILKFDENYTNKAKSTRTGHAQRVFRENKHIEALNIIINSAMEYFEEIGASENLAPFALSKLAICMFYVIQQTS